MILCIHNRIIPDEKILIVLKNWQNPFYISTVQDSFLYFDS